MIQTFFYSRNLFFALQRYKKQPLKRTVSNDLCTFATLKKIKKQEIWTIQTHERAIVFTNKTNGDVDCNASVPTRKEANNEKVSLQ